MKNIIVVNNVKEWDLNIDGVTTICAKEYLTDLQYAELRNARIFNCCKSYRYQSIGYYVSLLAQARAHKVIPSVTTIQDMKSLAIVKVISDEVDHLIQHSLAKLKSDHFILSIYFGKNVAKQYDPLAKQLYSLFQAPFMRATFTHNGKKWLIQDISPIPFKDIPENHKAFVHEFAAEYFNKKRFDSKRRTTFIYDLAILVNPDDALPPSNKMAIAKFIHAAEELGFSTELITKDDYNRLSEFDALLIRDTTAVNHYTYRFARRAAADGLVVLDDPESIVKCTNKVYLAELLSKAKISAPKTLIVHKDNKDQVEKSLGLPCVLKQPDSSFSQGVIKVTTREKLQEELENFLARSDLIICQEYIPTPFDWRIGMLNRQPLFACKYFMAKNHWQIYSWDTAQKEPSCGSWETVTLDTVPPQVLKAAMKAGNAIGDGFYGVDLKAIDDKVYVIEVNDNPSIDADIEDLCLKDKLYTQIMETMLQRVQALKTAKPLAAVE